MQPQTKQCQNCKNDFVIETDDFSFYEKIKVPPPTFCIECRMKRRMIWRNVRSLFRRECGLCKKTIISMYKDDGVPVYCTECWFAGGYDLFQYGKEYDFSRPFFVQLKELFRVVPRYFAYKSGTLVNSDYTNFTVDNKNAYLSFSIVGCEDISYSEVIDKSKNSMDCYGVVKVDGCYQNVDCEGNYNTHYTVKSQSCIDSYFLYDCVNCQNCCLSSNLRNQQYYFNNQKLSKEDYKQAVEDLQLYTSVGVAHATKYFDDEIVKNAIHKFSYAYSNADATGDYLNHCKNATFCFDAYDIENVKYACRTFDVKDSMDLQGVGGGELIYDSVGASWGTYKDYFCYLTLGCRECEYSINLKNCSNCFGCFGLMNAKYCIFNKQYEKDEYFVLVEKIKQHMMDMPYVDTKGRVFTYGEYFPFDMSPFGYNEGNSNDGFPMSKDEALGMGYPWHEREKRDYQITLPSQEVTQSIRDVTDDILKQVIGCPNEGKEEIQCATAYRITPEELSFCRQKNLPLPTKCPNCRHYDRLRYRNPMKLYRRPCSHNCGTIFNSTYAPDRPEKVYCESCYQKEVL